MKKMKSKRYELEECRVIKGQIFKLFKFFSFDNSVKRTIQSSIDVAS